MNPKHPYGHFAQRGEPPHASVLSSGDIFNLTSSYCVCALKFLELLHNPITQSHWEGLFVLKQFLQHNRENQTKGCGALRHSLYSPVQLKTLRSLSSPLPKQLHPIAVPCHLEQLEQCQSELQPRRSHELCGVSSPKSDLQMPSPPPRIKRCGLIRFDNSHLVRVALQFQIPLVDLLATVEYWDQLHGSGGAPAWLWLSASGLGDVVHLLVWF